MWGEGEEGEAEGEGLGAGCCSCNKLISSTTHGGAHPGDVVAEGGVAARVVRLWRRVQVHERHRYLFRVYRFMHSTEARHRRGVYRFMNGTEIGSGSEICSALQQYDSGALLRFRNATEICWVQILGVEVRVWGLGFRV